ncbi:MAG: hypothetical protein ACM3MK_05725, partial [Chitinophagales bacterium]
PDHQVREVEYRGGYYRFLIQNNHLVGIQSIGSLDGLGPLISMIKKQSSFDDIERILMTPSLLTKMPWMMNAETLWSNLT